MTYLQSNQFGFKDITVAVNVPENDTARLMYYFNCVCEAIEYNDNDVSRFRNYANWSRLSNEEVRLLVVLCLTLSPDVFNDKVFFQSDALCGNMPNKFFEINQIRHQLLAVQSIVIAGRTCQVKRIMTYKMSWMHSFYMNPMRRLAHQFNSQNQRPPPKSRSSTCVIS